MVLSFRGPEPAIPALHSIEHQVETIAKVSEDVVVIAVLTMSGVQSRSRTADQHCIGHEFLQSRRRFEHLVEPRFRVALSCEWLARYAT